MKISGVRCCSPESVDVSLLDVRSEIGLELPKQGTSSTGTDPGVAVGGGSKQIVHR